jgi:hypothetical protein
MTDKHSVGEGGQPVAVQEAPKGWKLVPVAPTPEMLLAATAVVRKIEADLYTAEVQQVYRAMLDASPTAPTGAQAEPHPPWCSGGCCNKPQAEPPRTCRCDPGTSDPSYCRHCGLNKAPGSAHPPWCSCGACNPEDRSEQAAPKAEPLTDARLDELRADVGTGVHRDLYNRIVRHAVAALATPSTDSGRATGEAEDLKQSHRGTAVALRGMDDWVAERWRAEVANRPMVNVHRRSLDDTWRQVLRYLGVDDRARLGPTHDELRAEISSKAWEAMNDTQGDAK